MRDCVRFTLNGKKIEISNPDPTQTLLNWLRQDRALTGTKEGCAEGDCGACTIVVGDPKAPDRTPQWRALNACIAFVPTLDGKTIVTVEGLANDGKLHPVQQALVDYHGSQCGFCTPGFVMSLYAHYRNNGALDDDTLNDVLAGNLCRCTGYAPIIRAAKAVHDYPKAGEIPLASPKTSDMLALAMTDPLSGVPKRYFAPRTMDELAKIYTQYPDATLLAGSTDVGLWVTKQAKILNVLIDIGRVEDFDKIEKTEDGLMIGAGASYADAHGALGVLYPSLGELIRRIGSTQIRNAGTIGGNIANGSPIGDMAPPLITLKAELILRKGDKIRRIALEDFFISYGKQDRAPGECVAAVFVPAPKAAQRFMTAKISKRFDQDISALCGAFCLTLDGDVVSDIRIVFGGMAGIPARAKKAETELLGQPWSENNVRKAMATLTDDFTPLSDMRASAQYRLQCAQNLLFKFWLDDEAPYLPRELHHG